LLQTPFDFPDKSSIKDKILREKIGYPILLYFKLKWEELAMSKVEVFNEIEQMFGLVPAMFKALPESSIELEWQLFKRVQMEEGPIPNKYRELIGVAISAISKCRYCSYFHTELAKLNGATEAEIEDAIHYAKSSAGWSTYVNGLQLNYEEFVKEIDMACEHVKAVHENA
jgi:AhpD family alkylhydroperoxidase